MSRPEFITNQHGNTLLAALQAAIPDAPMLAGPGFADAATDLAQISIATAFMSPAGFGAIAERLEQAASVRLLIGAEPVPECVRQQRRPGDPPRAIFERREVAEGLRLLEAGLRHHRDRQAFSTEARQHLRRMAAMLRAGKLETRRYERGFLHAKAMLLDGLSPGIIAGSSNLTHAGLTTNLELNLGNYDPGIFTQARAWFDALWDEAAPFDLAGIFEEPEQVFPPWLIFLRILWQLYGEELEQEREEAGEIPLTAFQLHGVWRAQRILRDFGGVIVADEVGLGKTFIGGAILEACARNRQRALLLCPSALQGTWQQFLTDHNIGRFVEMTTYDRLARDRQFQDARRPDAVQRHLHADIEEYALVVVDEAHNYRTPDAPYRAAVLQRLLFGPRKDLVLLTATPVNNSLFDLYYLMRLFLKQDSALARSGIVSVYERFRKAAKQDPAELNPDYLYPIIDAVTVKRTRAFVRQHYSGETIRAPDGILRPIVFPKAVPITIRYALEGSAPGLFDLVADALDPENGRNLIGFARYAAAAFRTGETEESREQQEGAAGLLRSGLLKRFESSTYAFRLSLERMLTEHAHFLEALDRGKVINTAFLRELAVDDEAFDDLLETSANAEDASAFDIAGLREAVARDRTILLGLHDRVAAAQDRDDPKLEAVIEALADIVTRARKDAGDDATERRNRKVLLFSYFADTVVWLKQALSAHVARDARLAAYRGRIAAVAGAGLEGEAPRDQAVHGFVPESSGAAPDQADCFDLLIATDVLAEGLNLQQCRNILNYELPWNPMRLVQRHGRIDRIGSPHPRVFVRTVFPADRLDALLTLQARILNKLTQAAKSIGVATLPVDGSGAGEQVFAETRAEIEKLAQEDPGLFDRGGTEAAAQTGEEYRQRLRAALLTDRASIVGLPGRAGSGMRRGGRCGVLFCAEVELAREQRSFLRFVPAGVGWRPGALPIVRETGTCLRLIDCTEKTPRHMPPALADGVFAFWEAALADILAEWANLSDPANLQPQVRRLNREIAAFLRAHPARDADGARLVQALDILEAPWPRREEVLLREQFRSHTESAAARSARLIDWVLASGMERFEPPAPLPPIVPEDVRLVCWMAIEAADG